MAGRTPKTSAMLQIGASSKVDGMLIPKRIAIILTAALIVSGAGTLLTASNSNAAPKGSHSPQSNPGGMSTAPEGAEFGARCVTALATGQLRKSG